MAQTVEEAKKHSVCIVTEVHQYTQSPMQTECALRRKSYVMDY